MKNIYKTILDAIIEPICGCSPSYLRSATEFLEGHDLSQMRYIGEMLERAMRYIGYSLALAAESRGEDYPADLGAWLGIEHE